MNLLMTISLLIGQWRYDGFYYQGTRYPNPNPHLSVLFTFQADHTARLYWKRDDEDGFCERKGTWELRGNTLAQKVTWLNPANAPNCGSDPDMQLKEETENRVDVSEDRIGLHMQLDSEDFIYILVRQMSQSETPALLSQGN